MKVIALSEGAFTIDKSKQFVPFNLQEDQLNERPVGSLLVEIQPFVVVTERDIILLDTGLGHVTANGELQLYENLMKEGIDPDSVTKVLLSHLHKDHAGGIFKNESDKYTLALKNATYYINRNELQYALEQETSSYNKQQLQLISGSDKICLLDDHGAIDGYIQYELSGGHSKFHQVFWIREDGETIFYGADVAPQLQQMKSRFVAKYDFDGKKSMELRRMWLEKGAIEKWIFLFYHDIKNPIHSFNK